MKTVGKRGVALTLLLLVCCGLALFIGYRTRGISIPSGTRSAQSTVAVLIKDENQHVITDNKRFTVVSFSPRNLFGDPDEKQLLLLESFWSDRQDGVEGQSARVTVEASEITLAGTGKNLWTLREDGDEGRLAEGYLRDRFYKVTKYGCCDAPNVYSYFFLGDGRKVYTSVTPLYEVLVPNTGIEFSRYVGYGYAPGDYSKAILQYGTDKKVTRQIEISAKGDVGTPTISMEYQGKPFSESPLMLWGADGKESAASISDFIICLRFYDGSELRFPVKNDDIELKDARVPERFKVSR